MPKKKSNQKLSQESSQKKAEKARSSKSKRSEDTKSPKEVTKLKEALQKSKSENEALKERLLRIAAEFDNTKKRTEREIAQIILTANKRLILDLLPVVDDLERSLKISADQDPESFRQGVELIYQKLTGILKNQGVAPMESVGQPFDVDKHDALLQVEQPDAPSGIVVQEHEKGYCLHDAVLRHAKVVVSK
jgi:molecular chaperone GrpE